MDLIDDSLFSDDEVFAYFIDGFDENLEESGYSYPFASSSVAHQDSLQVFGPELFKPGTSDNVE